MACTADCLCRVAGDKRYYGELIRSAHFARSSKPEETDFGALRRWEGLTEKCGGRKVKRLSRHGSFEPVGSYLYFDTCPIRVSIAIPVRATNVILEDSRGRVVAPF